MSKVVTSQGLQDFIETGKPTETISKKGELDKKLAAVDAPVEPEKPPPEVKAETKEPEKPDETGLEPEDHDLAERAKKRIGKKHYEMRKAQEEAEKARSEAEQDAKLAENLFNERELWRKRAEEAEKARDELRAKPQEPAQLPIAEPLETDPKYWNEQKQFQLRAYLEDRDKWRDENSRRQAEADRRRETEAAQRAEIEKVEAAFKERVSKAKDKYTDFDSKVGAAEVVLPFAVLDYLRRSEYGPDLAYFLADNKDVAEKIKAMHFTQGIAELARLETSFKKPAIPASEKTPEAVPPATSKTVERQGAPAPITPLVSGGSPTQLDPAKMSFQELRAYERNRARETRRR